MKTYTFVSDRGEVFHIPLPTTPRVGDEVVRWVGVSYTITGRQHVARSTQYKVKRCEQ